MSEKSEYKKDLEEKYWNEIPEKTSNQTGKIKTFTPKPDTVWLKMCPNYHNLSKEEQVLYLRITEGIFGFNGCIRNINLKLIAQDCNIPNLAPYLAVFIKETIELNLVLANLNLLIYAIRMVQHLIKNPYVRVKPILHLILPPVLSCIISRKISENYYDNHWSLRKFSANLCAIICRNYNNTTNNITRRVINCYLQAIKDPKKSIPTLYGGIAGLALLDPKLIKLYLLPNLAFVKLKLESLVKNELSTNRNQMILETKFVNELIRTYCQ